MTAILRSMVIIIIIIAIYDIYCTVKLNDSILYMEENKIALYFINERENILHTTCLHDANDTITIKFTTIDVSQLVAVKSIGLSLVAPFMFGLIRTRVKFAKLVVIPIFVSSLWLLERLIH